MKNEFSAAWLYISWGRLCERGYNNLASKKLSSLSHRRSSLHEKDPGKAFPPTQTNQSGSYTPLAALLGFVHRASTSYGYSDVTTRRCITESDCWQGEYDVVRTRPLYASNPVRSPPACSPARRQGRGYFTVVSKAAPYRLANCGVCRVFYGHKVMYGYGCSKHPPLALHTQQLYVWARDSRNKFRDQPWLGKDCCTPGSTNFPAVANNNPSY